MKKTILKILSVFVGALALLLLVNNTGKSANSGDSPNNDPETFVRDFCFDGEVDNMDVKDLGNVYTEKTNTYFNEKIKYLMTANEDVMGTMVDLNQYDEVGGDLCQNSFGGPVQDMTCQAIAVCNPEEKGDGVDITAQPFCMAVTLLGVMPMKADNYNYEKLKQIEPLKYSYFCYKAALDLKREALFDGSPAKILNNCGKEFEDKEVCQLKTQMDAETDSQRKAVLERQILELISDRSFWREDMGRALDSVTFSIIDVTSNTAERIEYIDQEIARAKSALDATLDAYSQLKVSWQMHQEYVRIFGELVKYRDLLAEMRKQTDAFPFRFIDATTTKCL